MPALCLYVILWSSGSIRMQRQRYLAVMLYRLSTEEEDHGGNGLIATLMIVPIWVKRCKNVRHLLKIYRRACLEISCVQLGLPAHGDLVIIVRALT